MPMCLPKDVKAHAHDKEMPCQHPFDFVNLDPVKGWYCIACKTAVIYCWVCAAAGIYNIHVAPECENGHMQAVYREPRRTSFTHS